MFKDEILHSFFIESLVIYLGFGPKVLSDLLFKDTVAFALLIWRDLDYELNHRQMNKRLSNTRGTLTVCSRSASFRFGFFAATFFGALARRFAGGCCCPSSTATSEGDSGSAGIVAGDGGKGGVLGLEWNIGYRLWLPARTSVVVLSEVCTSG